MIKCLANASWNELGSKWGGTPRPLETDKLMKFILNFPNFEEHVLSVRSMNHLKHNANSNWIRSPWVYLLIRPVHQKAIRMVNLVTFFRIF